MFSDITCSNCGEPSRIRTADEREIRRCPNCGRSFERDFSTYDASRSEDLAIDDAVVAWLARSSSEPTAESADFDTCFSCGYQGFMTCDPQSEITVCPACWAVKLRLPEEAQHVVDCPQCGQPISVYERDRGKTTVCPLCKYFLGCVLQSPKRRFDVRRFLGLKLGHRQKLTY